MYGTSLSMLTIYKVHKVSKCAGAEDKQRMKRKFVLGMRAVELMNECTVTLIINVPHCNSIRAIPIIFHSNTKHILILRVCDYALGIGIFLSGKPNSRRRFTALPSVGDA